MGLELGVTRISKDIADQTDAGPSALLANSFEGPERDGGFVSYLYVRIRHPGNQAIVESRHRRRAGELGLKQASVGQLDSIVLEADLVACQRAGRQARGEPIVLMSTDHEDVHP